MTEQEHETSSAAPEDAKARFREALTRKQEGQHKTADGRPNTGSVHGSETRSGGQRTFRRKTG